MKTQMPTPTPGQDYPRTWNEFLDWFATEEACQAFLEKARWPQGFVCPRCGNAGDLYRASRTRLMCRSCQYQGTVTSGTIFDKTRTPLRVWLAAAWYLTNQKQGVSALGLQRVLGLGSYLRIPRDGGHDSMLMAQCSSVMADSVPRAEGGQHSKLMADTCGVF
jgi:transposase-like protein